LICPISERCHADSFGRIARKGPAKPAKLMLIPAIAGMTDRLLNGSPRIVAGLGDRRVAGESIPAERANNA